MLPCVVMIVKRWCWTAGVAAICVLGSVLLALPCQGLAQDAAAVNQSSPSPYPAAQETALEGIDSAQENSDDLDPNLIPLEPELTASPPDLSSSDNSAETPSIETAETAASARSSGPQETLYNIPVVIDQSVQSHIRFFNTSIRDRFEQWLVRLNRYRPLVENIFAEFNLPSDLVHLSLVESGFNPYAYSRAKATGPWQFMKGTGKLYGLRIDPYVDERRDPIKSTVAAARYLRDLYDIFGTWPLAMAAYNAGEGKVLRALHKAQAESFSEISRTKLIRLETKQYVPRIMAATIIARNPDQYGFIQNPVAPHEFEEVIVTRPLHFRAISNVTGISYNDLRLLNPELRRDATPPDEAAYHLKVPVGTSSKVLELLERVPTHKFPPMAMMADRETSRPKVNASRLYRVRIGDTLQKISRKFGIPIKTIKARNNISGPGIRAGELLNLAR
ncbi:MAG: transglycosylase SLT domain-containing protein [Nitrospira sp.]|nr:transglycosylase SLT domain-containing protein [Nitrospira sp.]